MPEGDRQQFLRRRIARIGALVALWLGAVFLTLVAIGNDGIPAGTTVGGVDIGGLDRQSAINKLTASMQTRSTDSIKLSFGESEATVEPNALGLSFNPEATVDSVTTSRLNPFDVIPELFGGGEAIPVARVDAATFYPQLEVLSAKYSRPMVEPEITYEGTTAVMTSAQTGALLDTQLADDAILASYMKSTDPVAMPMIDQPPTVSESQARDVRDSAAVAAVSEPIEMRAGDVSVEIEPEALANNLSYQVRDGQLQPVVDGSGLHEEIADELSSVDTPAKDATWDVSSGQPVLVPSQTGNGVNSDEMAANIIGVLGASGDARAIDVRIGPLEPKLTTEQAAALNITEQISSFTQNFDYAAYRYQNIGQAAKKINNSLLMPGETFSFNERVGQRTKANGFTTGLVVGEGGKLREDYGGGVSAAATATWTAAFFAGLEKVEHGSHLIWISRYQPGLEATVSWGNLDLKFKNNTPNGVLITTAMTGSSMTVSMWGTKQFDEIRAESGEKQNVTPYTAEVGSGPECVSQAGSDGFSIRVERVFIKDGQEVEREPFVTSYIPGAEVECVSTSSQSSTGSSSGSTGGSSNSASSGTG